MHVHIYKRVLVESERAKYKNSSRLEVEEKIQPVKGGETGKFSGEGRFLSRHSSTQTNQSPSVMRKRRESRVLSTLPHAPKSQRLALHHLAR